MKELIPSQISEAELVKLCKKRNAAAQKILFTRHAGNMMMVCLRYIAHQEEAREVMMDGFLTAFGKIDGFSYQGEGGLQAWLRKITVNHCLMHLRKKSVQFVPQNELVGNSYHDTGENAIERINARQIKELIHELPDGCRTVFNLYVFEKMTHKEIAALLEVSESTSKSQLHRARTLLQQQILKPAKSCL